MSYRVIPVWVVTLICTGLVLATPQSSFGQATFGAAEYKCVSGKQKAAGKYCQAVLKAWSKWDKKQDDAKREAAISKAASKLSAAWDKAEAKSASKGVDCVEQTVTASDVQTTVDAGVEEIVTEVNSGLDLGNADDGQCGSTLLKVASKTCASYLKAESLHVKKAPKGGAAEKRASTKQKASAALSEARAQLTADGCTMTATAPSIEGVIETLTTNVVYDTVVSPGLDDTQFTAISPVGPIEYEGLTLNPRCGFDDAPDYHFFVKRGSVNKLVMYYQGGGACWENLTCGIPVCKNGADPVEDNPDNTTTGFADLTNPDNPFKDWNIAFVTYCTCDIHFGDIDQVYSGVLPDVTVRHRGFQNAKTVEKFAREHFLNPDAVFVTGSSAGGYGALFHGPLLHEVWPAAQVKVLGDASNGVITADFLQNEFNNWNFQANLPPEIPGLLEAIDGGSGMVGYIDAVAAFFPNTAWAHYSTAYDGGTGGQTGFYNVMLNGNNPVAAITWWEGSCAFNDVMRQQVQEDFSLAPENYRYYIGTGSRHTMYGSDKVYSDQTGGESQTVVDWIDDMLAYQPGVSAADDWQNVECTDCSIVLPGDPAPNPAQPPFQDDGMGNLSVVCP